MELALQLIEAKHLVCWESGSGKSTIGRSVLDLDSFDHIWGSALQWTKSI